MKNIIFILISLLTIDLFAVNYPPINTKSIDPQAGGTLTINANSVTSGSVNIQSNYLTTLNNSNMNITPSGQGEVKIAGVRQLRTDQYLDEPYIRSVVGNNTNLYMWKADSSGDFVTVFGGIDLALGNANAILSGTDHLGNTVNNNFGGKAFLTSSNQNLNGNGNISMSIWAHRDSWSINFTTSEIMQSRSDGTNGWYLNGLASTTKVQFTTGNSSIVEAEVDCSKLDSGWNKFYVVRTQGVGTSIYINDKIAASSVTNSTIISAGNFEVGSYGNGKNKWSGKLQEPILQFDVAWTYDDIIKLYAASSLKPAIVDIYDNILLLNKENKSICYNYEPTLSADMTTSTGPTNNSYYCIIGNFVYYFISLIWDTGMTGFSAGSYGLISLPILSTGHTFINGATTLRAYTYNNTASSGLLIGGGSELNLLRLQKTAESGVYYGGSDFSNAGVKQWLYGTVIYPWR